MSGRVATAVRVRYHKTDLETKADFHTFDADDFEVIEDNTLLIRRGGELVALVHPERWDAVYLVRAKP